MKRTALQRSTKPMKRTRLKPKRGKQRRSGRIHDPAYMARVRELPCAARFVAMMRWSGDLGVPILDAPCRGLRVAHHAGRHGMGQKCSDYETVSLCDGHHHDLHCLTGMFFGWRGEEIREWEDAQIAATQRQLGYVAKEAA